MSEQQERAINVAERLSAGLQTVGGEVASLRTDLETDREASQKRDAENARYSRITRLLLLLAAIGLVFDITGTTLAVVAIVKVSHNSATIGQVHQSNLSGCQVNNTRLANQAKALDSILEAVAPPSTAPLAQRQAAAAFEAKAHAAVSQGWAPRNCQLAYKLPGH